MTLVGGRARIQLSSQGIAHQGQKLWNRGGKQITNAGMPKNIFDDGGCLCFIHQIKKSHISSEGPTKGSWSKGNLTIIASIISALIDHFVDRFLVIGHVSFAVN
jgi:hypothetical protein